MTSAANKCVIASLQPKLYYYFMNLIMEGIDLKEVDGDHQTQIDILRKLLMEDKDSYFCANQNEIEEIKFSHLRDFLFTLMSSDHVGEDVSRHIYAQLHKHIYSFWEDVKEHKRQIDIGDKQLKENKDARV